MTLILAANISKHPVNVMEVDVTPNDIRLYNVNCNNKVDIRLISNQINWKVVSVHCQL